MDGEDETSEALAARCASQLGAVRRHRWGETVYMFRRHAFAFLGPPRRPTVTVKAARKSRDQLLELPFVERAHFIGRLGWLTVHVRDAESLNVALELIDSSYQLVVHAQCR